LRFDTIRVVVRLAISLRDQSFAHTKSIGILNVSLGLCRALGAHPRVDELLVISNSDLGRCAGSDGPRISYVGLDSAPPRGRERVIWDQWGVARALPAGRVDWLILPKGFPPLMARPAPRLCCYVHDDIAWRAPYARVSPRQLLERAYFGASFARALCSADVIATNSEATARSVRGLVRGSRPVACVGVGFDQQPRNPGPPEQYIVVLTSAHPHKRTSKVIDWLVRWVNTSALRVPIIGIGSLPKGTLWPSHPLFVHHTRLDEGAYQDVVARAAVLVYYSAYEGYGMPPREALAQRRWAVASDLPALREDIPQELLFRNDSYAEFALRLESALASALAGLEPPSLRLKSWRDVAVQLLEALARSTCDVR
jgi:hypothetical protein